MKAARLYQPGLIRIEEMGVPKPRRGEVLVETNVALTCGTDVKMYRRGHPKAKLPLTIGHEFSGIVEEVGEDVEGVSEGMRVVAANSAPCLTCHFCRKGLPNLCERLDDSIIGFTVPGAYAEYVIIPAPIVRQNTFQIPDGISFERMACLEPLACVLHGSELVGIELGDTVAILGAGAIGLLHLQLAKLQGAERVIALDISPSRLRKAEELGADEVVGSEEQVRSVLDLTSGYGADVVIEAVGRPEAWEAALRMARKGGRILLFGGCPSGTEVSLDTEGVHYGELSIHGAFHHTPQSVQRAFELISSGLLDPSCLISGSAKLDAVVEALESVARGEALKVAITP